MYFTFITRNVGHFVTLFTSTEELLHRGYFLFILGSCSDSSLVRKNNPIELYSHRTTITELQSQNYSDRTTVTEIQPQIYRHYRDVPVTNYKIHFAIGKFALEK